MDIHNYEKMYEGRLEYIRKAKISERNKKIILDFNNALILQNISKPRLMKYLWTLNNEFHHSIEWWSKTTY